MSRLLPISILLVFGMLSCNRAVKASELSGTWVMRDTSRQRLPSDLRQAAAKIVLEANGTFVVSDMPGLFYIPPGQARLDGGTGAWRLFSREGRQQVQLDFQRIVGGDEHTVPYGMQLNVSIASSSVSLFYSLGDPDEGRRVELEKK